MADDKASTKRRGWVRRALWPRPVAALFPPRGEWRALAAPFLWAAISGAALATAFPPLEWGGLAWIGLAPLLVQLPGRTARQGAWIGLVFGFVFFALNLLWLLPLRRFNPFAPAGIALMAGILATSPALFGALAARLPRGGWRAFVALPALWTAVEAIRGWTELAFPWMLLGHTQVNAPALIQVCDLTGVAGLSFLVVAANAALAETWECVRHRRRPSGGEAARWATAAGLAALALAYGAVRLGEPAGAGAPPRTVRVALVQPGVPQPEKMESSGATWFDSAASRRAEELQRKTYATLSRLVTQARADCETTSASLPDIYVLSETAFTNPYFCLTRSDLEGVHDLARAAGAPLFFGADRYAPPAGTRPNEPHFYDGRAWNSAFLATPSDGVLLDRPYDKMHLVPFGEFSSYFSFIPGFTDYILGIADMTPGAAPRVFEAGVGARATRFGAAICFESCFPAVFREYDRMGVDWMAVITNDAWYGLSSGARRHQALSVFRAVEMRRPIVRVANTGISCTIDSRGRTLARLPLAEGAPVALVTDVPLRPAGGEGRRTLYMRVGGWFTALCFAAGAAILWGARQSRSSREGRRPKP